MLKDKSSWLDRPLLAAVTLDWEKALYGLFIALAVLSRLWNLGFRVFSHDETVHGRWAWNLYQGGPHGYEHHPLSHGPFLFNVTALFFYLFGDNDVTARLAAALLGIVLVAAPYTLRRWLGRSGALVASFLFLISPSMLYYSRYDRNDVPIVLWSLFAVLAMFKYLETGFSLALPARASARKNPVSWLLVLSTALSLMFATKEVSFIYIAIFGLFLIGLFFARLGAPRRSSPAWGQWKGLTLTLLGLLGLLVLALGLFLFSLNLVELFPLRYRDCAQAPVPEAAPEQAGCAGGCELVQGRCQRLIPVVAGEHVMEFDPSGAHVAIRLTRVEMLFTVALTSVITLLVGIGVYLLLERLMPFRGGQRPALDLILFMGTFTLPFLAPVAINGLSRLASHALFGVNAAFEAMDYSEAGLLRSAGFVFVFLAVSVAVGLWWDWRRWLVSAGVFYVIFVVLFTNVFTNGNGLASGMVGSLAYWLEQQAVERGNQPLYCYVLWVSLYDYLPLTGFLASFLYVLTGRLKLKSTKDDSPTPESPPLSLFPLFLFFWTALSWFAYTAAGERMPWMAVHIVAPMILASGWIVGKFIEGSDWRAIVRRGGWLVLLVAPVGWAALVQTVSPWLAKGARPFAGRSLGQLEATQKFLAAALVLALSLLALRWAWERIGGAAFKRTLLALALAVLAVFTIRTAWTFAYVNPDNASEFLVFAHGAPDVRHVMQQVEDISRRSSGDLSLPVAYTADGSYPFIWYLRNYANATQLPNPPSGPALDKPVIIAGDAEWGGIQPYLGDNYVCNHHNFMWWPMQDYYGLTWERVRYALTNPEMRAAVWDIAFRRDYRKYEQASGKTVRLSEWPLRDGFHFCVRRDVMAQVWREGAGPADFGALVDEAGLELPDYVALERFVPAELELKDLGQFGNLHSPHGMALDAEGFLYVADTDNHRIVKFSSQGEVVDTWDSTWWHGLESWQPGGCLDAENRPLALGDGEFCEPWGVAVGPEGRVYVADTWNHRVQVFDAGGRFLAKVGVFGQSGAAFSSAPEVFYGPRDVAVDGQGRVYVSDTGNKRIQVFAPYEDLDADLNYLTSLGGPGIIEGRLDEPVGLAIGAEDLLYVADTWNRRVQVLTLEGAFVRQWPVGGWESQSSANKPYLACDAGGRVYVSDPEGMRLVVFDAQGAPLAALKGARESFFRLPVGVLVDGEGRLWVSDAAGDRVLRLGGVE